MRVEERDEERRVLPPASWLDDQDPGRWSPPLLLLMTTESSSFMLVHAGAPASAAGRTRVPEPPATPPIRVSWSAAHGTALRLGGSDGMGASFSIAARCRAAD